MNNLFKLLPVIAIFIVNSCSFANKSTVTVPINSNPPGAMVVIDGETYGPTPTFISLKPSKNYQATFSKIGYEPTTIDMTTWYSVRGGGAEGGRCILDSVAVLPITIIMLFAPEKCGSFKQSDYYVDLQIKEDVAPSNSITNKNPYNQYQGQYQRNSYQENNYYNNQLPYHDNSNQISEYQNSYYKQYQKSLPQENQINNQNQNSINPYEAQYKEQMIIPNTPNQQQNSQDNPYEYRSPYQDHPVGQ